MSTFIVDMDETVCLAEKRADGSFDYPNAKPIPETIQRINDLYAQGHKIILFTARGNRTFKGDKDKIKEFHLPILTEWVKKHGVMHHEIITGKPWGEKPIYVDNRNLTLRDFVHANPSDFEAIIERDSTI